MRAGSVAVVFGTRPEVVKLAPLLWEMGPTTHTIHTGQHPLPALTPIFADLELTLPDHPCVVSPRPRGRQIGEAIAAVTDALIAIAPEVVVVQGDTNSTLAGAVAASSLDLPLVHVEAGLRAFDRRLPEERNRIAVDHLADLHCAPTETARGHLRSEGIVDASIIVTGNTVVDAARRTLPDPTTRAKGRARWDLTADEYIVATFHRPENVDDPTRLAAIVERLAAMPRPVLFPAHPRTVDRARAAGVALDHGSIRVIAPLGYRDFLALAADAAVLVSDSGGVQEEASILGRPAVILRRSTERPEVIGTFATLVADPAAMAVATHDLLDDLAAVHRRLAALESPFGDGHAAVRIAAAIEERWGEPSASGTVA